MRERKRRRRSRQRERELEWAPALREGKGGVAWHAKKVQNEGEVPTAGVDYAHTHSEQEREEAKGTPIVAAKDNKTMTIMAIVVPSKAVDRYAAETAMRMAGR